MPPFYKKNAPLFDISVTHRSIQVTELHLVHLPGEGADWSPVWPGPDDTEIRTGFLLWGPVLGAVRTDWEDKSDMDVSEFRRFKSSGPGVRGRGGLGRVGITETWHSSFIYSL